MAANKRAIKSDLRKADAYKVKRADYEEAPELTNAQLAGAIVKRRGRPPLSGAPKSQVTLRLDADILASYRELGEGWQSQINTDLRRARKLAKVR